MRKEVTKEGTTRYRIKFSDGKTGSYSDSRHGKYAKKLAEIAEKDNIKYGNYFQKEDNYVKIFIYMTKLDTYKEGYLDLDDWENYKTIYLSVHETKNNEYLSFERGNSRDKKERFNIHQLIMGSKGIDHINGNGLDNRKSNLRDITQKQNSTNLHVSKGCVPIIGISYSENLNYFKASWNDASGKQQGKYFYITSKLTAKQALIEACKYRNKITSSLDHYVNELINIDNIDFDKIIKELNL